jgi:hypothetical protein
LAVPGTPRIAGEVAEIREQRLAAVFAQQPTGTDEE